MALSAAFAKFLWAERQQESGQNYRAVNGQSGALGAYQVMPGNLPGWERECGMPPAGPAYFLGHNAYQDRMASCILGRYVNQFGFRGAASLWYSGQPNWHATFGNPPVYVYVNDVIRLMGGAPSGGGGGVGRGTGGPIVEPKGRPNPPTENYAPLVRGGAGDTLLIGRALQAGGNRKDMRRKWTCRRIT